MDSYTCFKCGMKFDVVDSFPTYGETTTCSEKPCRQWFWHSDNVKHHPQSVRVAVLAEDFVNA